MGYMDYKRELRRASLLCVTLLAVACGPLKPEVQTITIEETIYTDRVVSDTIVITTPNDTIVMEKERLSVRVVRINDTLIIQGECAADTIYRTTTIEVPVKIIESRWPWWAKPLLWVLSLLLLTVGVRKVFGI
jgi:hypothetical protein